MRWLWVKIKHPNLGKLPSHYTIILFVLEMFTGDNGFDPCPNANFVQSEDAKMCFSVMENCLDFEQMASPTHVRHPQFHWFYESSFHTLGLCGREVSNTGVSIFTKQTSARIQVAAPESSKISTNSIKHTAYPPPTSPRTISTARPETPRDSYLRCLGTAPAQSARRWAVAGRSAAARSCPAPRPRCSNRRPRWRPATNNLGSAKTQCKW